MGTPIHVAILDDHQSILDGYCFRLDKEPDMAVVATATHAAELEPMLSQQRVDVLLLDLNVPTAPDNHNPYPVLYLIPRLLDTYPNLHILIISMYSNPTLIRKVLAAGASGYILKDDQETIQVLGSILRSVAGGGIHYSKQAHEQLLKKITEEPDLTARQVQALSVCAAYPNEPSAQLAERLHVAHSTLRNLLSQAYVRLGVNNRTAAIAEAQRRGLLTPLDQGDYPAPTPHPK